VFHSFRNFLLDKHVCVVDKYVSEPFEW